MRRTCSAVMPCSSVDFALCLPESKSFCIALSSPRRASCIRSCSIGSGGGVDSRSLISTLLRPSLSLASDALLRGVSRTSSLAALGGPDVGITFEDSSCTHCQLMASIGSDVDCNAAIAWLSCDRTASFTIRTTIGVAGARETRGGRDDGVPNFCHTRISAGLSDPKRSFSITYLQNMTFD
jgi:hypothetical protein